MRKNVFGRQFKRDVNERKALFKGLMSSLVLEERIQTTEEKAKAIRSQVERLVTKARVGGRSAESLLQPYLSSPAVKKMMTDVAPRFATRPGGYTRMMRVGKRFSDNATVVIMEWVEKPTALMMTGSTSAKKPALKKTKQPVVAKSKVATPKNVESTTKIRKLSPKKAKTKEKSK